MAKWLQPFSLLAANLISNPVVKVSPKRTLRSSIKYLTRNPKISVNPSSILQLILAKQTPTCPIFADGVWRGPEGLFLPLFPLFGGKR